MQLLSEDSEDFSVPKFKATNVIIGLLVVIISTNTKKTVVIW